MFSDKVKPESVTLNWDTVAGAQGYIIRGRGLNSNTWTYINVSGNVGSKTVNNLPYNKNFEWQVRTLCGIGDSSGWTGLDTFRTQCGSPTPVSVDNITSTSARLNWQRVSGAIGYEIRGRKSGGPWVQVIVTPGNKTDKTITTLDPSSLYE